MKQKSLLLLSLSLVSAIALGQGDPQIIAKIVDEGKNRSC